jgi:hypothetical protein
LRCGVDEVSDSLNAGTTTSHNMATLNVVHTNQKPLKGSPSGKKTSVEEIRTE